MKPEHLRRHVVSFKTSDLVLNFLRVSSNEECETISVSVWPAPYCAEVGDIRKVCS